MATTIHFMNAGQGNMVLCQLDDGTSLLYDCNLTGENEDEVLRFLGAVLGWRAKISIFVNSHRDADHMRGVKRVHEFFPIQQIWDSGVTGNSPDCTEYREYMDLRRRVGFQEVERRKRWTFGKTVVRVLNSRNDDLSDDPNAQSIVLKVQQMAQDDRVLGSTMLTGDTDACTWRHSIQKHYGAVDLKTDILLGSHHGSLTFFDDPGDAKYYYLDHLKQMAPAMTVISVGKNGYGHPDSKALEFYEKHSSGSDKGNKIKRTDEHGNIKLLLKDGGGWSMWHNQ